MRPPTARSARRACQDCSGLEIDLLGKRSQVVVPNDNVLGISAHRLCAKKPHVGTKGLAVGAAHRATTADILALGRADAISDLPVPHVWSEGRHLPRDFMSKHKGRRIAALRRPAADQNITTADTAGTN